MSFLFSDRPRTFLSSTVYMFMAALIALATPLHSHARPAPTPAVAVASQYDTTHVYVPPESVDAFVQSFIATFGGQSTKQAIVTVTPTPSSTTSQLVQTPVGTVSVFGFKTPIPFPFGLERNGYLVTDLDQAVNAARRAGADVIVAPFPDPIGRDAIVQWPGGVNMQLYWHTTKPAYAPFQAVPDNRVYVSPDKVAAFVRSFIAFSHGKVGSDDARAPGADIGRPGDTYRRLRIDSAFGRVVVFVTDGHLPYPYGHENTGYAVSSVKETLARASAAGVQVLVAPFTSDGMTSAVIEFPGGYVAEIHGTNE